jgi:hypothetical protein
MHVSPVSLRLAKTSALVYVLNVPSPLSSRDDRTYREDAAGNNIRTDSSYTKMAGLRTLTLRWLRCAPLGLSQ